MRANEIKSTLIGMMICFCVLSLCFGCGGSTSSSNSGASTTPPNLMPDFTPPHGGILIELTNDHSVHGELVVDEGEKSITFHVLGPTLREHIAANSVAFTVKTPDGQTQKIPMKPVPEQRGLYRLTMEELPVKDPKQLQGSFEVTIAETVLTGELKQ